MPDLPTPEVLRVFRSNKSEGYPSEPWSADLSTRLVQYRPFPTILANSDIADMNYNQGYPIRDKTFGDVSTMKSQTRPFPKLMMSAGTDQVPYEINESYPCNLEVGDISHKNIQEKPYPNLLPSFEPDVNEGYPAFRKLAPSFGAFSNCPTLIKVKIPKTVKWIDDWVFYNTGLTGVRIARDCQYFPHTFPPDCIVEFYDE